VIWLDTSVAHRAAPVRAHSCPAVVSDAGPDSRREGKRAGRAGHL